MSQKHVLYDYADDGRRTADIAFMYLVQNDRQEDRRRNVGRTATDAIGKQLFVELAT